METVGRTANTVIRNEHLLQSFSLMYELVAMRWHRANSGNDVINEMYCNLLVGTTLLLVYTR